MRSPLPDLSGLAALARDPHLDLRPVILRVQADLFAGAPARDAQTVAAFEALALGLLPVVDDETALIVARRLAPCPDTPVAVMHLLIARGGEVRRAILAPRELLPEEPAPQTRPPADRPAPNPVESPARDPEAGAIGPALAEARTSPALARRLLRRPDLGAADAAVLYLHADAARRAQIRAGLDGLAQLRNPAPPRADAVARQALIEAAARRDRVTFAAQLGGALGAAASLGAALDLAQESGQEFLALALHAAGLSEEECIRIFLTLDPGMARSVSAVFHLADLIRSTPRGVAAHLVEAVLGAELARAQGRRLPAMDPSGAPPRQLRAEHGLVAAARDRRSMAGRERRAG